MSVSEKYRKDLEEICAHRYDLGSDLWTSEDKRILKGSSFSLIESVQYLLEIGMKPEDPLLMEAGDLLFPFGEKMAGFKCIPKAPSILARPFMY